MNRAPHLVRSEERRLLGCERDQLDRTLRRANTEQSRQLQKTCRSAGVIVRARQITRGRERIVVRSYDELVTGKRSEVRDDIAIRSSSLGEGLLGDSSACFTESFPDVCGCTIEILRLIRTSRAHRRCQELDVPPQDVGRGSWSWRVRQAATTWLPNNCGQQDKDQTHADRECDQDAPQRPQESVHLTHETARLRQRFSCDSNSRDERA